MADQVPGSRPTHRGCDLNFTSLQIIPKPHSRRIFPFLILFKAVFKLANQKHVGSLRTLRRRYGENGRIRPVGAAGIPRALPMCSPGGTFPALSSPLRTGGIAAAFSYGARRDFNISFPSLPSNRERQHLPRTNAAKAPRNERKAASILPPPATYLRHPAFPAPLRNGRLRCAAARRPRCPPAGLRGCAEAESGCTGAAECRGGP